MTRIEMIEQLLKSSAEPLEPAQITAKLNILHGTTKWTLRRLERQKRVKSVDGKFIWSADDSLPAPKRNLQATSVVQAVLSASDQAMTVKTIAQITGLTKQAVGNALRNMSRKSLIHVAERRKIGQGCLTAFYQWGQGECLPKVAKVKPPAPEPVSTVAQTIAQHRMKREQFGFWGGLM
jgi:Mn-dependent DtxR family transcriptional regulator